MTEQVIEATGEIVPSRPAEVLARGALPAEQVQLVEQFLAQAMPDTEPDPAAAALSIVAQVLNADTPEEVLADLDATGIAEGLDQPFVLERIEFRRSEYEAGMPFYANLFGRDATTGESVLYTTGSQKIVAQVFRMAERGWLPRTVVARRSKKATKAGYFPLRLVDGE